MKTILISVIAIVFIIFLFRQPFFRTKEKTNKGIEILGSFTSLFKDEAGSGFLKAHRLIKKDTEHVDIIKGLLEATLNKDMDCMRKYFARNAIVEIGDETMNDMLKHFISYCNFTDYSIRIPIEPSVDEFLKEGKTWKVLKGPLELTTDKGDYRIAIKCCSTNEESQDEIGIWSIYIIEKVKDTNQDYPYYGDLSYTSGIYFDVARIR